MSFLPHKCRQYLNSKSILFEEIEQGGQKGIVLKEFILPGEKFDSVKADILLMLPSGYPDAPPDMFYTKPWLRLKSTGHYAYAADQPFDFNGVNWQRWSRHNDQWRTGVDGIWTMLKRIVDALGAAK